MLVSLAPASLAKAPAESHLSSIHRAPGCFLLNMCLLCCEAPVLSVSHEEEKLGWLVLGLADFLITCVLPLGTVLLQGS